MSRQTVTINLDVDGLWPIEVKGIYYPYWPGTYWQPPEGPEFAIQDILSNGESTNEYDDRLEEIEEMCIELIEKGDYYDN